MGIKNLLPSLKQISKQRNVSEYSGQTAGVDALCWMHQGAHKYAKDLVNSKMLKGFCNYTSMEKLINYCMGKLRVLQMNGVKCILVFDGARLNMKKKVEDVRHRQR